MNKGKEEKKRRGPYQKKDERLVMDIISALCAHYEARRAAIENKTVPKRVRMEYAYLNSRLLTAAAEIVGHPSAEGFIRDIGEAVGYAKTELEGYGETSYKKNKICIKINMAKKLYLL